MNVANRFACMLVRGDKLDLGVWMLEQDAQEFRSAVA